MTYAELVVRYNAAKLLKLNNHDIIINIGENGKPFIENYTLFHFSISYSDTAFVVALSSEAVGVDIEKMKILPPKQMYHFFTSSEMDYLNSDKDEYIKRFYELWTKKEAYTKMLGIGLNLRFDTFSVLSKPISEYLETKYLNDYIISYSSSQKGQQSEFSILSEYDIHCCAKELS
jgi:4'-phosphopantetheinyl transferase